ncbi:MAG: NAD(P)H-dependent oxidoreductase [Anaerolineales bacterium]|nr:NAD(P)H-dependent oxidoreductase [Anaerolineales bacterium]
MKVLALNGSPRMKASSTYHMFKPFLEGMEAAGAETEVIHIRRLHLEPCIGCYTCWARTPGVCIHEDGMAGVLEKFNHADMVIFGTPLYHFTMSGVMKDFIDRLLPRLEPWLIPHPHVAGVTGHPERVHKPDKVFLISPCGFPEFEHFESLVATFKHIARMENWEYVGELLRPGAEPLSRRSLQGLFTHYYDLVRQAGEQIARQGSIADELQAELRQDLFPGGKQAFYDMAAGYWTGQMDRFKVPEEIRHTVPLPAKELDSVLLARDHTQAELEESPMEEKTMVDRSSLTCREIIAGMPSAFSAEAAGDMTADIQFHVTGEEPGDYHLQIKGGTCTFREGTSEAPRLTIHTPSDVWVAVSNGEMDSQQAFMQGRYRVEGDFSLLMKLNDLFQTG